MGVRLASRSLMVSGMALAARRPLVPWPGQQRLLSDMPVGSAPATRLVQVLQGLLVLDPAKTVVSRLALTDCTIIYCQQGIWLGLIRLSTRLGTTGAPNAGIRKGGTPTCALVGG